MQASTSRWRTRPGAQLPGRRWRGRTSLPTLGWTSSPSTWWSWSPPSKYLALRHRDWSSLSWQACQPESVFFCEGKYCKQDDSLTVRCQKMFLWNHLRLARFFCFFTSLGKKMWNPGMLEKLKYCLRPTGTNWGSFCFLVPPKEQLFPILLSGDFAFFHFSDIFKWSGAIWNSFEIVDVLIKLQSSAGAKYKIYNIEAISIFDSENGEGKLIKYPVSV